MNISLQKPSVILFDVNETLLDLREVSRKVNKSLGSKRGFKIWFGMLLHYSLVDTVTRNYHDFGTIAGATLDMAAQMLDIRIPEKEKTEIQDALKSLPPHDDVTEGLQQLKDAGFRLATLTNSAISTQQQQLESAGLIHFFEATISVEEFRLYKPHVDVYKQAAEKLGVSPTQALMVAAHGWDMAGALAAGLQAAFIQRKGQSLYPLAPRPQVVGKTLVEVAEAVIKGQKIE